MKTKLITKILAMLLMFSFITATPAQAGILGGIVMTLLKTTAKAIVKKDHTIKTIYQTTNTHMDGDIIYQENKDNTVVGVYNRNVTKKWAGKVTLNNCFVYAYADGGTATAYMHLVNGTADSSASLSLTNNFLGAYSIEASSGDTASIYTEDGTSFEGSISHNCLLSYTINGNAYGIYAAGDFNDGVYQNAYTVQSDKGDAYGIYVDGAAFTRVEQEYISVNANGTAYGIYMDLNSGDTSYIKDLTLIVSSSSTDTEDDAVGILLDGDTHLTSISGTGASPDSSEGDGIVTSWSFNYDVATGVDFNISFDHTSVYYFYIYGDNALCTYDLDSHWVDIYMTSGYTSSWTMDYESRFVIDVSAVTGSAVGIGLNDGALVDLIDGLSISATSLDGNAVGVYTEANHQVTNLSNTDITVTASGKAYGYLSGTTTVDLDTNTAIAIYNNSTGTSMSAVETLDYETVSLDLTSTGNDAGANFAYGIYVEDHTLGSSINFDNISVTAAGTPFALYLNSAPINYAMDIDFQVYTYSLAGYGVYAVNSDMTSSIGGSFVVSMPDDYSQTGELNLTAFYLENSTNWNISSDIIIDAGATNITAISLDNNSKATYSGTLSVESYSSANTDKIQDSGSLYVYTLGTTLASGDSLLFYNRGTKDSTNITLDTNASIDVNDFTAKLIEEAGDNTRTEFTYGLVIDGTNYDSTIKRFFSVSGVDYGVILTDGADLSLSSAYFTGYTDAEGNYTDAISYVDSTSSLTLHAADNSSVGTIYVSAGGSAKTDEGEDASGTINLTLGTASAGLSVGDYVFGNLLGNLYITYDDLDLYDDDGNFDGSALAGLDGSFDLSTLENKININVSIGDYGALLGKEITIHNSDLNNYINLTSDANYITVSTITDPTGTSNIITVDNEITIDITDSYDNTGKVYFSENNDTVNADIVKSGDSTVVYYELNEGDEQTIDKINGGGFANSTGYLVLSGGTLNTTNSGGDGMIVNNDTDISTNNLILESGTINLNGALSFDDGESTIGSVEIVGGTTKLGIFANKLNEGKSSTVKLESDSTLHFNSGYLSLREDSAISVATDATDTTLIIEGANLTSIENPNVTPEDYILTISDITTVSIDDSTFDLAVVFEDIDSLSIADSTINYALTFEDIDSLNITDSTINYALSFEGIGELNLSGLTLAEGINIELSGDVAVSGTVEVSDGTAAYKVASTATLSGEVIAYGTGELIAIEATDGAVNLADNTVVSALIFDTDDNFVSYGTALTNAEGTDGLTLNSEGTVYVYGNIITKSPLIVETGDWNIEGNVDTTQNSTDNDTITIETGAGLIVEGGTITTGGDSVTIDGTLILTTDSNGDLANFVNVGTITVGDDGNLEIDASDLALGTTAVIADDNTLNAGDNASVIEDAISDSGYSYLYENGSIYFVAAENTDFTLTATNANEEALANAVNGVSYTTDEAANTEIANFKSEIEDNGLSAYIMSNYSQIAEVNSMLLSNMNVANVNRAREILHKNASIKIDDEDGTISFENEDGEIEVVDAERVSLIKYSNVAQLQSINLLGSKDASNGVAGYDYWSVGSTANFDEILNDNALIGASIGGTYNKVEGDAGDNANSTTFLLNFYGIYANEGFEAFANVGYAHFWNEGSKAGVGSADWDSDAFNALIGISYDLETTIEGLTITPLAMLNLVYLNNDSASYSNGVSLDSQEYMSAKIMLGFEFEYAISSNFNAIIRTMYTHECGDDTYDFTYGINSIVSGVQYAGSQAGKDAALMGLGLSYDFSETCTAYFDYNAYAYSNLITHSLNLSIGIKF